MQIKTHPKSNYSGKFVLILNIWLVVIERFELQKIKS